MSLSTNNEFPPLRSVMDVDMMISAKGDVLIAYEHPFSDDQKPSWIEFCEDESELYFFSEDGRGRTLGTKIHPPVAKQLRLSKQAGMICVDRKDGVQSFTLPILVKGEGSHV